MSQSTQKLITIGRIGSPHGVKGWVKVYSFTEPADNILDYQPWQFLKNGRSHTIKVIDCRKQNKALIVQLENCHDRDLASTYTGTEIVVEREQLPTLSTNQYYWSDLEGLTVSTKTGQQLGVVESVFATGANDVLVVVGAKRHLIPFLLKQVILNVDLASKTMQVDWDPDF
jgi:16S rRNA processing protein RimM